MLMKDILVGYQPLSQCFSSFLLLCAQMITMSDETEQRMCDEDFASDEEGVEGDVESYLEDNSSELMDRLRELEARK